MLGPAWTNRHRAAARARRNRRRDRRQPFRFSLAGHCLCCRTLRLFATAKVIAKARNGMHAETDCLTSGFARWIEVISLKGLETLAKTWIPTFTPCPAHFLRFRLGKPLK